MRTIMLSSLLLLVAAGPQDPPKPILEKVGRQTGRMAPVLTRYATDWNTLRRR